MARLGADLIMSLCGERPRLLTHCNTGVLATVTGGTALAVAFELHRRRALAGMVASEVDAVILAPTGSAPTATRSTSRTGARRWAGTVRRDHPLSPVAGI